MTPVAMTFFFIGSIVLYGGLITTLTITIKNARDGFDTSAIPEFTRDDNSGFGLSMMKERIYLLSGKISISSKPGEGCIVKVIIPVNKED